MTSVFEFFRGSHRRLSSIIRYNTTPKFFNESVAQHSYYVVLYSMVLMDLIEKEFNETFDHERVLTFAAVHDTEECFSGDIVRNVKKKMEDKFNEIALETLHLVFETLPNYDKYIELWKEHFKKSKEYYLVYAADLLSAVVYSMEEEKMGNHYMKPIVENNLSLIKDIPYPWGKWIYGQIIDL